MSINLLPILLQENKTQLPEKTVNNNESKDQLLAFFPTLHERLKRYAKISDFYAADNDVAIQAVLNAANSFEQAIDFFTLLHTQSKKSIHPRGLSPSEIQKKIIIQLSQ